MHLSRNKKFILAFALMTLVGLVPLRAHAFDFLSFISSATGISASDSFGSAFFHIILSVLTPLKTLLLSMITGLANVLNWVISLHANTGGQVVYAVWKVLRDLCNMAFIVVIIVTSFGTIFNVFKIGFLSFYNIYNPKLIRGFLMAAIMINFSLAIGQSVVTLSNHVTDIVIGLFPSNIGGQIAMELQVGQTLTGDGIPRANVNPAPGAGTTTTAIQGAAAPTDEQKRTANKAWDNIFLGNYLKCVNREGGITNTSDTIQLTCYQSAAKETSKLTYPEVATSLELLYSNARGNPPPIIKVGGFLGTTIGGQNVLLNDLQKAQVIVAANLGKGDDTSTVAAQVTGTIYSIFMLMVLVLSFLAVVIFMLIRIPAMWVILALSPLAWVSLLTSDQAGWKEWWKEFMAWNYFTPLYLGMIYLGLYLLSQQPNLLASLTGTSPIDSQIGMLLFYILVGMIFIGGTAGVVKMSFLGGTAAGNWVSGISSKLGIDDKRQGAVGAVYRGLGLQNQVAGITQRIQQSAGDLRANVSGRLGGIPGMRSQEEAIAAAQRRYGVRGGEKDYAAALKKRVDNQQEILKGRNLDDAALKKMLNSGNRDAALAAGEILLAKGKLDTADTQKVLGQYGGASSTAQKEFQKRINDQRQKEARKTGYTSIADLKTAAESVGKSSEDRRKFLETAIQGETGKKLKMTPKEMLDLTELMKDNADDQRGFLEAVSKSGRNKVAAIETMANLDLIRDRNGNVVRADQALADRAASFTTDDLLDADEYYAGAKRAMPVAVEEVYKKSLGDRNKSARMFRDADGPEQQARLHSNLATVKQEQKKKEDTVEGLGRASRKLGNKAKEVRVQAKQEKDATKSKALRKLADQIEDRQDKVQAKLSQIRKS